jgi:KDO2-lipid IV(A) lauroyltransferase
VATQTLPPFTSFLHPRHWPTWVGVAVVFVIAWLPWSLRMAIGNLLGRLTYLLATERRYITRINIERCFPELSPSAQHQLLVRTFVENGIGLIETTTSWMRPPEHFKDLLVVTGQEHMDAAIAQGRGVLMLGAHYSTLDFCANLLGLICPFGVTFRPHGNPLFDAFMLRGRLRNCNGVFDRRDIRGAFRHLKQGKILWYAPDQDYGPEQAVFAPFFGRTAATITATTRFAAINNSPVILVRHHRLSEKRKYVIEFIPVTPPFPTGDDVADATRINKMIETAIRMDPAQYLWMHKRFKTQPHGKPQSPYIMVTTHARKLDAALYEKLTAESIPLPENKRLQLHSGLQLWRYPGLARGLFAQRHPALQIDNLSKHLRSHGIVTVTIDNLFLMPFCNESALTCHIPRGEPLHAESGQALTPQRAALLLARLHNAHCHFVHMNANNLLLHNNRLAVLDPLCLQKVSTVDTQARVEDLKRLLALLSYTALQQAQCVDEYLSVSHTADRTQLRALMQTPMESLPQS